MKRSDYHMLVMFAILAPHLNPWVAVFIAVINLFMACIWAVRE